MRCPTCGHVNNSLATRCAACGAILDVVDISSDDTVPQVKPEPAPVTGGTAEQPRPSVEAPVPAVEKAPELRDVAGMTGQFVANKRQKIGAFFSQHQRALGVGLAVVVVGVLGVVWLVINLFDAPAYSQIEADVAEMLGSYEYAGGTFGPDLDVPLSRVGVTERSSTRTPEGLEVSGDIGPTAFNVEAEATFDDGKIHAVRNVGALYVRSGSAWQMAGDLAEHGMSLTARAGVDEQKVLDNMDAILDAASETSNVSLADIYSDGSFSVVGNVFKEAAEKDTATNDVTIHCSKQSGFFAYEGNVIAHFAFESGTWALRNAEADSKATTRTYEPLVGTWVGELTSTSSNGTGDCFGAQKHALEVSIDSVGDSSNGSGHVQGTVTVVAHHHDRLDKDQLSYKGDELLERVAFSGTIRAADEQGSESNLLVACTTTGSPEEKLEFTLSFGVKDDPSAVLARVISSHEYEETVFLFIPHQTTAEFTDMYELHKS